MNTTTVRFRLDFDDACSIGPGKIDLLERIRDTGSLSHAGRELGMSYRRAWVLLDSLNGSFREPMVATSVGGKAGGGATLTKSGAALLSAYRDLQREFDAAAAKRIAGIDLQVAVPAKPAALRTPLVRSSAPRRVKPKKTRRAGR